MMMLIAGGNHRRLRDEGFIRGLVDDPSNYEAYSEDGRIVFGNRNFDRPQIECLRLCEKQLTALVNGLMHMDP